MKIFVLVGGGIIIVAMLASSVIAATNDFDLLIDTKKTDLKQSQQLISDIFSNDYTSLKDDAYHYNGEENWIEWWYFTFIDEKNDLQLYFIYLIIINPWFELASMMIGVFNYNESYEIRDYYDTSEFSASYNIPEVYIGSDCKFVALNEDIFNVIGKTKNERVSWNLTYTRSSIPYYPNLPSGDLEWLSYIPGAQVTGSFILNGINYNTSGSGYHDHNWGETSKHSQWRWATTCNPSDNFSIVFNMVGNNIFIGSLAVLLDDEIILFENPQVSYKDFSIYFKFSQSIPILGIYPKAIEISDHNTEYEVTLKIDVNKNQPLYIGGATHVVNEQVSKFKGVLKGKNITYTFDNIGFSEYTKFRIRDLF